MRSCEMMKCDEVNDVTETELCSWLGCIQHGWEILPKEQRDAMAVYQESYGMPCLLSLLFASVSADLCRSIADLADCWGLYSNGDVSLMGARRENIYCIYFTNPLRQVPLNETEDVNSRLFSFSK